MSGLGCSLAAMSRWSWTATARAVPLQERIAGDLDGAGATARVIDLASDREDGYDLTDWLADRRHDALSELALALGAPAGSELA